MRVASEDFPAGFPLGCLIDDFLAIDRFVAGMPGFDLPVWIVRPDVRYWHSADMRKSEREVSF